MNFVLLILAAVAAVAAVQLWIGARVRGRSADLVESAHPSQADVGTSPEWRGRIAEWLSKAGFRRVSAPSIFWAATAAGAAFGVAGVFLLNRTHAVEAMVETLESIPGGVGDTLAYVAVGAPYIIVLIFVLAPTMVVRAARRERVQAIEQDLALTLELLATLAEAGLGFDAAIARIQESESGARPLSQDLRIYQQDTLGGISRTESLRRLAARIDLNSVSIFVSALIQAEQVGASLSETLRRQADDLRDRRKLRALLLAQALPVKLAFPLMFCFLPGIFFSTLGPVLNQLVDVVDAVIRRR